MNVYYYLEENSGWYSDEFHGPRFIEGEPNPDTLIPLAAVEVTAADYERLKSLPTEGDENGYPVLAAPRTPTQEELLVVARAERDRLLVYATLRINPLQYAADVDDASEEDLALLKLWKKYSVAVSKTETKPGWPEAPQWPIPPIAIE